MVHQSDEATHPSVPGWLERAWASPWPWMALIALLFCAPLFTNLHQQDFDNDEAIYSFAVDTMVKDGDWLTPKSAPSESEPFFEKPPLKFWLVALPIKAGLLPANEFGMRFWDAVMGSVAFLYVFAIGRRLAGPLCGFAAVFLLFTNGPLVLAHGLRTNNMEAAVFLSYAAAIYHFMAWRTSGPDDRGHIFAMALFFVLGFMTKFVAAIFLPMVLCLAVLVKREDRLRLRFNWLTFVLAGLLALALIAPWFVYQQLTHPQIFFERLLSVHVVKRFTAYLDPAHLQPWYFYFTEVWHQLRQSGVAELVAFGAGLLVVQTWRRRWLDGALMVIWFAAPIALISFGTSKLYHYAYPFLPPVALAGGYGVATVTAVVWRWFKQPAAAFTDERDRSVRLAVPLRMTLTSLGVATLLIAMATSLAGPVRLVVGGTLLFRNASVFRPLVAGVLALLIGGPPVAVRALVPVFLVASVLPISAYRTTVAASRQPDHVLGNARACLSPVVQRIVDAGGEAPVVWVEAEGITHRFNYYLRGLGSWQQRPIASDTTVATHLFEPGSYGPVLITAARYLDFKAKLAADAPGMLDRTARHASVSVEALTESFRQTELSLIEYEGAVILLPGPYSVCGTERGRKLLR